MIILNELYMMLQGRRRFLTEDIKAQISMSYYFTCLNSCHLSCFLCTACSADPTIQSQSVG